jgi:hypothetical protein
VTVGVREKEGEVVGEADAADAAPPSEEICVEALWRSPTPAPTPSAIPSAVRTTTIATLAYDKEGAADFACVCSIAPE